MAKIMIADDSETLRLELKDALEASGHTVIEAVDGLDGVRKAEEHDGIDFILSDYNMPGVDGITMVTKIKAMPKYANTPIGMLTTESSKELKTAGKDAGIVVWFVKPFEVDRLMKTMDKILEKINAPSSAA